MPDDKSRVSRLADIFFSLAYEAKDKECQDTAESAAWFFNDVITKEKPGIVKDFLSIVVTDLRVNPGYDCRVRKELQ